MKTLAFFFALMLSPLHAAEDAIKLPELTIKGETYKAVTVTLGAPNEAKIQHQDGSRFINPMLLSEDLRKRLGYDPAEAAKAAEIQKAAAKEDAKREAIQALPVTRFWVLKNGKRGLIIGDFKFEAGGAPAAGTGLSRIGGGGNAKPSPAAWHRGNTLAFIPHNGETLDLLNDTEFKARVQNDGTVWLTEYGGMRVTKYKLAELVK